MKVKMTISEFNMLMRQAHEIKLKNNKKARLEELKRKVKEQIIYSFFFYRLDTATKYIMEGQLYHPRKQDCLIIFFDFFN